MSSPPVGDRLGDFVPQLGRHIGYRYANQISIGALVMEPFGCAEIESSFLHDGGDVPSCSNRSSSPQLGLSPGFHLSIVSVLA